MADFKDLQAQNAERIVSQFLAVQKELRGRVEEGDLDKIAATGCTMLKRCGCESLWHYR
jgi:hypothetical protein